MSLVNKRKREVNSINNATKKKEGKRDIPKATISTGLVFYWDKEKDLETLRKIIDYMKNYQMKLGKSEADISKYLGISVEIKLAQNYYTILERKYQSIK